MIAPDSPVTTAALDAWFANAHLPNAHRMAAALEAAVAEFRRRNVFAAIALPPLTDQQREQARAVQQMQVADGAFGLAAANREDAQ